MMSGPETRTCARRTGCPVSAATSRPLMRPVPVFMSARLRHHDRLAALERPELHLRRRRRRSTHRGQQDHTPQSSIIRIDISSV